MDSNGRREEPLKNQILEHLLLTGHVRAIENRAQMCVRDAVRSGRPERTLTCRENLHAAAAVSHGGSRIAGDLILFCLLSPDFLLHVGVALTLTLTSHTLAPAFWAVPPG